MREALVTIKKWLAFFAKGLAVLPRYYRSWGFVRATLRTLKAGGLTGLNGLAIEFYAFSENLASTSMLIDTERLDYIVFAPDYTGNSAGIFSLYKLCNDLKKLGYRTAVTGSQVSHPSLGIQLIPFTQARRLAKTGTWVIYPEVVRGNPLRGTNVVRWVLNRPGLLGGAEVYPESEHIFVYSDFYAQYVQNQIRGKLYVPTLDTSIFYSPAEDYPRTLACYYVGKSKFKPGHFDVNNTFEITRQSPAKAELGKLLRSAKVLYSFDNSTALSYEAVYCGCPVVIIPDGTQTWEDYQKLEMGTEGIFWGSDKDIPKDFKSKELLTKFRQLEESYIDQLKHLANYTQLVYPTTNQSKPSEICHLGAASKTEADPSLS